jgi:hypothetical protein
MVEKGESKKNFKIKAIAVILLMVIAVVAVPSISGQSLMNSIEKENKKLDIDSLLSTLNNYNDFEADREKVIKLMGITDAFLVNNKLKIEQNTDLTFEYNFKESDQYNSDEFQNFISGNSDLEDDLEQLARQASDTWEFHINYGEEQAKEVVVNSVVKPFFTDLFNENTNEEYASVKDAFYEDSENLANDWINVYKAKSKTITADSVAGENHNFKTTGTMGFVLEHLLIGICTAIFLANWVVFGNTLGIITEPFVGLILGLLLVVPAIIVLAADVVVGSAQAAFEALLATTMTMLEAFGQSLANSIYHAGFVGLVIWTIAFIFNLGLVPLEFFVVFLVYFYENADYELGYITNHLGPLISEILLRAAENAYDIWQNIFGPTATKLIRIRNVMLSDLIEFISRLFKKASICYTI